MKTCHDNLFILDTQVTLFMSRNHAVYWALSSAKFCKFCFVFRYPCRVSLISEMIKNKCLKKRQIMPTLYFFSRALHVEHYQIYELCSHKRNFFLDTTGPHWGKILENASCLFLRRYFSRVTVCHGGGEMKSTFAGLWNKFLRLEGLNLIDHPQPQFHKMFTFSHFIREAFKNYLADFFR